MKKYTNIFNLILGSVSAVMLLIEPVISILIITVWLLGYYIYNRESFELKVKHLIKHIWLWMQKYDGLWSPLFSILLFFGISFFTVNLLGLSVSTFDPGVLVSFFLSQAVTIMIFTGAIWGLRFEWKDLFDYLYKAFTKEEIAAGNVTSSKSDFKLIEPWQRLKFLAFVFCFYVVVSMINFLILV